MSVNLIELILVILCISHCLNFYMTIQINNKVTKILEYIEKNQETLIKSLDLSNKYLKVIAEQHGYR
jgi:hypothetical protein